MGGLLDKFENVKVDAAARIDTVDAEWCEAEHQSYMMAHGLYTVFRHHLSEGMTVEANEWKERNGSGHNSYSYLESYGDAGLSSVDKRIKEIQLNFSGAIIWYFSKKYDVSLDSEAIRKNIGLKEPENNWRYSSHSNIEKEQEEYRQKSTRLLHYNEIVDEILLQLGGLTFTDKAIQQIKDDAKVAAHNRYHNKCFYEINKKVIKFCDSFSHWTEQHRAVLLALWHFNTGTTSMAGSWWQSEFAVSYSYYSDDKRVGSAYEFEDKDVRKMRYFKNGRWDITFSSAELADRFARDYLGY